MLFVVFFFKLLCVLNSPSVSFNMARSGWLGSVPPTPPCLYSFCTFLLLQSRCVSFRLCFWLLMCVCVCAHMHAWALCFLLFGFRYFSHWLLESGRLRPCRARAEQTGSAVAAGFPLLPHYSFSLLISEEICGLWYEDVDLSVWLKLWTSVLKMKTC